MRKLLLLGLGFLGMATVAPARQRAAVASAVPAPAVHAMSTAPIASSHSVQPHVSPQVHAQTHKVMPGVKPAAPQKPVAHPLPPLPPSATGGRFTQSAGSPGAGVVLAYFGSGGFYVPVANDTESAPQEEAQENDSNQQPESNLQASDQEPSASAPSGSNSNSDSPEEPLAEFVFVQRDGSTLFAVAYTTWNNKVQYVTKEGLRRTVALDSLDLDATQKLNEERGNTINLPAPTSPA
jgi:hypothetical protein